MKRITSGIETLDNALNGGIPSPFITVIAGEPGTGKTTFVMQLLFRNMQKLLSEQNPLNKTIGLYMAPVAEPLPQIQRLMSQFEFFDESLIKSGQILFCDFPMSVRRQPSFFSYIIRTELEKHKPKVAVIDPISFIEIATDNKSNYRELIYDVSLQAKRLDINLIITTEISRTHILDDMLSYLADGIIVLSYRNDSIGQHKTLEILKMRGTPYKSGPYEINIAQKGFTIRQK